MTILLYLSYSSELTEDEKRAIDKSVLEERIAVRKFVKKVYKKGKVVVITIGIGLSISVSTPKNTEGIGISWPPPLPTIIKDSTKSVPSYTRLTVEKQNKMTFRNFLKNERVSQNDQIYFDRSEKPISTVDKTVKLRGGNLTRLTQALFRVILLWTMGQNHAPAKGFKSGRINPGFGHQNQVQRSPRIALKLKKNEVNRNNPGQKSCRVNQNNQDGTLTKEQRRNLPSPNDVIISEHNVIIRNGQIRYKIKKHGHFFGIESTQNSKGRFRTKKTPENIKIFKDEIKNLVLNGKRIEGTYRKAEPDGYPATHFYDPETGKNAIFKQKTTEFVSAWRLNKEQIDDLVTNGNVGDY